MGGGGGGCVAAEDALIVTQLIVMIVMQKILDRATRLPKFPIFENFIVTMILL